MYNLLNSPLGKLFLTTPRFVGPKQQLITNSSQLIRNMHINSGITEGFWGVFAWHGADPIIDKAFFDCDYGTIPETLKIGQTIFEWCVENKCEPLPVSSGVRGPHIYPTFKEAIYPNPAELLTNFSYMVIDETEVYKNVTIKQKSYKVPQVDTKVIGDLRRLCRAFNTQRVSVSGIPLPRFCVAIDPERFLDMDAAEFIEASLSPNEWHKINLNPSTKFLTDFDTTNVDLASFRANPDDDTPIIPVMPKLPSSSEPIEALLKRILKRPCLYKTLIYNKNPPYSLRYATVVAFRNRGISQSLCLSILRSLNWVNWNEQVTRDMIRGIYTNKSSKGVGRAKMEFMNCCHYDKNEEECSLCH